MNRTQKKMIGLALFGLLAVGCNNVEDASATSTDEAALSAAPDGKGPAVCGPAHDPHKDRDHRFHKRCEHYSDKRQHRRGRAGNAGHVGHVIVEPDGHPCPCGGQ